MSPEELVCAGGATLAFDTNAILGFTKEERRVVFGGFLTMCDNANRLREEAQPPLHISIVVPSLARMEALHDLRVSRGNKPFNTELVKAGLAGKAQVVAFDEDAALKASGALHRWFSTDEAWQRAKRARCLEALRIPETTPPGKYGLASIDWAIATQSEAEGWILVTDDVYAEFQHVSRKITKDALRRLLDRLLAERGLSHKTH